MEELEDADQYEEIMIILPKGTTRISSERGMVFKSENGKFYLTKTADYLGNGRFVIIGKKKELHLNIVKRYHNLTENQEVDIQ